MELLSLDSNFQPNEVISNYESLIWTERYAKNGDFQLVSGDVVRTQKMLPTDSYVSLGDSTVPMMIDYHTIEKPKGAGSKITVTGRTCEACWLERRASVKDKMFGTAGALTTPKPAWTIASASSSDAAYEAMRVVLGDTARYLSSPGIMVLPVLDPAISLKDAIPQVDLILPDDYQLVLWSNTLYFGVGEVVAYSGTIYQAIQASGVGTGAGAKVPTDPTYWTAMTTYSPIVPATGYNFDVATADLYSTVANMIATNHHGIKSVRPLPGAAKVGIEIYVGTDRRSTVVFDARLQEIDDAKYLLGKTGSTNIGYVYGKAAGAYSKQVDKNSGVGYVEPSGLDRRVLVLDYSSDDAANSADILQSRGLVELYKNNATALFGGEVAIQVANEYNKSYFLGDILKLVGEYGLEEDVQVAEFIRSEDNSGEKAYPTFEAVT